MNTPEPAIPVTMVRPNLDNIPVHPMPPGFRSRWYQPGDDRVWTTIWRAAEQWLPIAEGTFREEFGADDQSLGQRMVFFFDDGGRPVATSTAWSNPNHNGRPYGQVHWVAVIPEMQGRGLARPLMTITCQRLKELGHARAYLGTHHVRTSAINLYLAFGFQPEILTRDQLEVWKRIQPRLKYPVELERFANVGRVNP